MGFPGGSDNKESACNAGDLGSVPGLGRSPEKKMATHSSILAWEMPQTEKSGRLQSMGWQKSWTQVSDRHTHTHTHSKMDDKQSSSQQVFTVLDKTHIFNSIR